MGSVMNFRTFLIGKPGGEESIAFPLFAQKGAHFGGKGYL